MRVHIKSGKIRFVIPCPIVFLKFGLSIAGSSFIQKYIPEKDKRYVNIIDFKKLSKCMDILKEYRGLKLVEVKVRDGSQVTIIV
ncbi:hypothetical protein [Clostridium sp. AWRP]|uniref:hypothetical protein n=1 Tax=Clostridium sp. AWRP TaxID=2212991 RepID=UPI000FDBDEE7|nr:hypothetical protein [Clostridium sp. AWRP]AZV55475.1 hypothetical protein DMR38_01990 [Clostridium sp. AWRP]